MNSCIILDNVWNKLEEKKLNSYNDLKVMKENGKLDSLLDSLNLQEILKSDFTYFLDIIFDEGKFYYQKLIFLEKLCYNEIYDINNGIFILKLISLYCNCEEAYINFPAMLKAIITKCDIKKYEHLTGEDINNQVHKCMAVSDEMKDGKKICKPIKRSSGQFTNYNNYDYEYDEDTIANNPTLFFVKSEQWAYEKENSPNKRWVSRYDGDGYGFDILSYDYELDREKVIEVKSGVDDCLWFTNNELKVMRESEGKNVTYCVYKWFSELKFDPNFSIMKRKISGPIILTYNSELDLLVDENGLKYEIVEENGIYIGRPINNEKKLQIL